MEAGCASLPFISKPYTGNYSTEKYCLWFL